MTGVIAYFSRVGLPISEQVWLHYATDPSYRIVAEDVTTTDIEVTSTWLGWVDGDVVHAYETVVRHAEGQLTLAFPSETEAVGVHRWLVDELGGPK